MASPISVLATVSESEGSRQPAAPRHRFPPFLVVDCGRRQSSPAVEVRRTHPGAVGISRDGDSVVAGGGRVVAAGGARHLCFACGSAARSAEAAGSVLAASPDPASAERGCGGGG
jgi:hypothetical protein